MISDFHVRLSLAVVAGKLREKEPGFDVHEDGYRVWLTEKGTDGKIGCGVHFVKSKNGHWSARVGSFFGPHLSETYPRTFPLCEENSCCNALSDDFNRLLVNYISNESIGVKLANRRLL